MPLLICMSWRLALDKIAVVCPQCKSSDHPDHHQRVHLQGLKALFHSVLPRLLMMSITLLLPMRLRLEDFKVCCTSNAACFEQRFYIKTLFAFVV